MHYLTQDIFCPFSSLPLSKCHPDTTTYFPYFSTACFLFCSFLLIRKTSEKKRWSAASGQTLLTALPFKPCHCRSVVLKRFSTINMPLHLVPSVLLLLVTGAPVRSCTLLKAQHLSTLRAQRGDSKPQTIPKKPHILFVSDDQTRPQVNAQESNYKNAHLRFSEQLSGKWPHLTKLFLNCEEGAYTDVHSWYTKGERFCSRVKDAGISLATSTFVLRWMSLHL